jgi:hypothetical protein
MRKIIWVTALAGVLTGCSTDNGIRAQDWDLNGVALSLEQAEKEYEECQAAQESEQSSCDNQKALYERNLELYESIMKQLAP